MATHSPRSASLESLSGSFCQCFQHGPGPGASDLQYNQSEHTGQLTSPPACQQQLFTGWEP